MSAIYKTTYLFQRGDIFLSFLTTSGKASETYSTSSFVLYLPTDNLIEPCASSGFSPMPKSTCDGCNFFEEQAEPVAAAIPLSSSMRFNDSPSIAKKRK